MAQKKAGPVRVRDIMTAKVITVDAEHSLREVVDTLSSEGVSGAPVMTGDRVVGVISITDILDFLAMTPGVPVASDFSEWGEYEESEDTRDEASRSFFTDLWEDAGADLIDRFNTTATPEWDLLAQSTAGSIMTRRLQKVGPDMPVELAARKALKHGVHRLVVFDGDQLAGIVSTMDFVHLVAEGRGSSRTE